MSERDQQVRALYAAGTPMAQLVEHFGVSRQRIHQILRSGRALVPGAGEVAARRKDLAHARENARLDALARRVGDHVTEAAARGRNRAEVLEAVRRDHPGLDITHDDLGAVLARAGVALPPARQPGYSPDALKAAIYYALAISAGQDRGTSPVPAQAVQAWAEVLAPYLYDDRQHLTEVARAVATGQQLVDSGGVTTLTHAGYLQARRQGRTHEPQDGRSWPPDSVTLKRALGEGTWAGALAAVGLHSSPGKPPGRTWYTHAELEDTVETFRQARPPAARTRAAYLDWRAHEAAQGRPRPGVKALLAHYQNWTTVSSSH